MVVAANGLPQQTCKSDEEPKLMCQPTEGPTVLGCISKSYAIEAGEDQRHIQGESK
jgi:hypothetical protein